MFIYPKFSVEIVREVNRSELGWPEPGEANDETGFGGNRAYLDLRGLRWSEAERVARLECELVARIESAEDPSAENEAVEDELFESDDNLSGLDLGIAAAVFSLSAAGCVPFASCNGGTFGGHHHESYPLVAFYARRDALELLLAVAAEAEVGMSGGEWVVVFADDVRKMMRFAACMYSRRQQFRATRKRNEALVTPKRGASPKGHAEQLTLDLGLVNGC